MAAILMMIKNGRQEAFDIVFKYAERKEDLVSFFSNHLEVDSLTLTSMINSNENCSRFGFDTNTISAMFIPNTYNFYWNTSSQELLKRMKKEYDSFWTDNRKEKAKKLGLSQIEVSILASIVVYQTV